MPELPDVEGWKRYVNRFAAGRSVERVEVTDPNVVRNTTAQGLGQAINGRTIENAERAGKYLLVRTGEPTHDPTVVLHFGMTGELVWRTDPDPPHDHDRVLFHLDGGRLDYRTQRKLGGVWLAGSGTDVGEITGELGPDAADLTRDQLVDLLEGRRGQLKSALMDQDLMAGVGNELSDEILWQACLHPHTSVGDLDEDELDALHEALESVLSESVRHGRIPRADGWLESVRDDDEPDCPRCGAPIDRIDAAGRTSYVCPEEQPAPP